MTSKKAPHWQHAQHKTNLDSDHSETLSEYENTYLKITERTSNLGSAIRTEIEEKYEASHSQEKDYTFPRIVVQQQEEG